MRTRHVVLIVMVVSSLGALGAARLGAQDTSLVRVTPKGVLVDFQDADLRAVITALAEAGNLNVTYGDVPPTRITLRLRQPVAKPDILPLLRSLAQSNGLRIIEEGSILRFESADAQVTGQVAGGGAAARGAEPQKRLYVYRLKHARAVRLAQTIQAVFGSGTVAQQSSEMRTRPLSEYLRDQQIRPFTPRDTVPPVAGPRAGALELTANLRADVQIVPDETTNSLMIRAVPDDYEIVKQAIEAVDLRPLQVLIEVLIAEVRLSKTLDVGVSAKSTQQSPNGNTTSGQLTGESTGDFVFKITRGGKVDVDVAISALASRGNVRIVSRPLLFAQNNLEAKILVGSQRPFVQVLRSLPTDAGVRDQIVQYRDVGTSLAILPTINPDGYVTMQVTQEVSSATSETQFGAPVISTREATTHLFVKDGQTAVFGGLVDQQRERTRTGIPVLMNIPLLGFVFGTTKWNTTNNELFLFLTPHIVQSDEDLDRLKQELDKRSPEAKEPPVVPVKKP
jgi:general secretion pathway protein D